MIIYDNDDNWRDYDMAPRDRRLFNLWTFLIQFHWTASLFTRLVVYESGMVGGGVIISVFKVFICLIRRVLLTSERGPLYRYPSQLIYWCIYSELSIVGLLRKKGVYSYLFHIKAIIRKFPWSAIDWSELYNGKGPRLLALSIFLF